MKDEFSKYLSDKISIGESTQLLNVAMKEKFGCTLVDCGVYAAITNEMFQFNIWFATDVDSVFEKSCVGMPDDEDELIEKFREKNAIKKNINDARDFILGINGMEEKK